MLPGKMAGQVLQAQLASEGSLEAWAFQAPKVAVVTLENQEKQGMLAFRDKGGLLAKTEKLVLQALWGPRAWLGKEESRVLQVLLVFRGFLGLQGLLGKVESQVIKVFLESLEQLALWDLGEKEGILEKEASRE